MKKFFAATLTLAVLPALTACVIEPAHVGVRSPVYVERERPVYVQQRDYYYGNRPRQCDRRDCW